MACEHYNNMRRTEEENLETSKNSRCTQTDDSWAKSRNSMNHGSPDSDETLPVRCGFTSGYDPGAKVEKLEDQSMGGLYFHATVLEHVLRNFPDWQHHADDKMLNRCEVQTARFLMVDSIRCQMVTPSPTMQFDFNMQWQPDFIHKNTVSSPRIFFDLFGLNSSNRGVTYKFRLKEFEKIAHRPFGNLLSESITVEWNQETREFSVSDFWGEGYWALQRYQMADQGWENPVPTPPHEA